MIVLSDMLAFSRLPLLLSILFSRSSVAAPLSSSSLLSLFPALPLNESLALSIPYNLPTVQNITSLSGRRVPPGKTKAGWDWIINVTEGLLACQREDAPDAWIDHLRTLTYSGSTTNVSDMREMALWCFDPQGGDKPGLRTLGSVDAEGVAVWTKPVRIPYPQPSPPTEMPWPVEHDIAEAAAVVPSPFSRIEYTKHGERPCFLFFNQGMPFYRVDAIDLSHGPY